MAYHQEPCPNIVKGMLCGNTKFALYESEGDLTCTVSI